MLGVGDEDSHFVASWWLNEVKVVSAWRHVFELAIEEEDLSRLRAIARSRTEPASRVERAQMLLASRQLFVLCGGQGFGSASSDSPALRGARGCLWSVGGTRRAASAR